ncbi:MAG: DUF1674 domain-containing protein [Chromatiales bacterium]
MAEEFFSEGNHDKAARSPVDTAGAAPTSAGKARELGGPKGPEPTRYGDWERNGKCVDF